MTLQAPLIKGEKKQETCEEQLRRMCKDIADSISDPLKKEDREKIEVSPAADFMEGVYDIRYIVDREKRYLGAELMVAGGGPTIWVDTFREQVTGWWGSDRVQWYYQDNIGLNDYFEEMYG